MTVAVCIDVAVFTAFKFAIAAGRFAGSRNTGGAVEDAVGCA